VKRSHILGFKLILLIQEVFFPVEDVRETNKSYAAKNLKPEQLESVSRQLIKISDLLLEISRKAKID
jgi:hypothetical protein